jgi:hypothetical protein
MTALDPSGRAGNAFAAFPLAAVRLLAPRRSSGWAQLMLGYGVTAFVCYPGDHPVSLAATGPLFAALDLTFDAMALGRLCSGRAGVILARLAARMRLPAGATVSWRYGGLMSSLWFFAAILFNVIASVMVPPCARLTLTGAVLLLMACALVLLSRLADMLFSVHMAQHLLLIAVAAPLLVLGGVRENPGAAMAGWALFM